MKFVSLNPATEQKGKEFEGHSKEQCEQELQKAVLAQKEWKKTDFSQRKKLMLKAAQELRNNKQELAHTITIEMGKPITQSLAEIEKCAWCCEFYAENAENFLQQQIVKTENTKSFISFEPLGVVFAIMPWNFPFWQVFRFAAPAIMAGNAGVLKHASNVPECALAIQEVFEKAGFAKNIFTTLLIDSKTALELIPSEHISAVTVTGSTQAGSQIAKTAGENIKKCVLELGGSDPFIVLEDADPIAAAKNAVAARTINSGQSCIAAKRFIVHKKIAKDFEKELAKQFESLIVGNPLDPKTQIGPMAKKEFVDGLLDQINRSLKMGAKIIVGGKKISGKGFFLQPTILGDVTEKMPAFVEETFGPIAPIIVAQSNDDAIRLANQSEFGLSASIWTKNQSLGEELAAKIEAGAVFVNKVAVSDPRMPFGGIKKSGFGRELSEVGIKEFINIKSVVIQ